METTLTAIELTGQIDENNILHLDDPLPLSGPKRVRVIVLYATDDELDEADWLKAATKNPVFDFLNDPEEDIYGLADGVPYRDEAIKWF